MVILFSPMQEGTMHMHREIHSPCPCDNPSNQEDYKQVWYADDAAAVGRIVDLRDWWDEISTSGPGFGYFPNAPKTWLVTKEGLHDAAVSIFANTGVSVTSNGRPYLGAAIGSREYVAGQVESKVKHTMPCNYSRDPTPCCLLSSHAWVDEQVDIFESHNPRYRPPAETTQ